MISLNPIAVQLLFTVTILIHLVLDLGPQVWDVCHWSLLDNLPTIPVLKGEGYQLSLQVVTNEQFGLLPHFLLRINSHAPHVQPSEQ